MAIGSRIGGALHFCEIMLICSVCVCVFLFSQECAGWPKRDTRIQLEAIWLIFDAPNYQTIQQPDTVATFRHQQVCINLIISFFFKWEIICQNAYFNIHSSMWYVFFHSYMRSVVSFKMQFVRINNNNNGAHTLLWEAWGSSRCVLYWLSYKCG